MPIGRWPEDAQIELAEIALRSSPRLRRPGDENASPESSRGDRRRTRGEPATDDDVEAGLRRRYGADENPRY